MGALTRKSPAGSRCMGPSDVARAGFRQAHAAGRAVQQPRGDVAFKLGDVLADGGRRQAQLARRRREPALLHDLPEDLQRR
ncbi:hypothetical protein G6F31_014523 [Rhizopus arrhizus]|nr:hypothetical protein G6F31_014523 [Rhizopus arrhizus]